MVHYTSVNAYLAHKTNTIAIPF